jgi:hypothetical protein
MGTFSESLLTIQIDYKPILPSGGHSVLPLELYSKSVILQLTISPNKWVFSIFVF